MLLLFLCWWTKLLQVRILTLKSHEYSNLLCSGQESRFNIFVRGKSRVLSQNGLATLNGSRIRVLISCYVTIRNQYLLQITKLKIKVICMCAVAQKTDLPLTLESRMQNKSPARHVSLTLFEGGQDMVVGVLLLGMSPRIQNGGHPNFRFNPQS